MRCWDPRPMAPPACSSVRRARRLRRRRAAALARARDFRKEYAGRRRGRPDRARAFRHQPRPSDHQPRRLGLASSSSAADRLGLARLFRCRFGQRAPARVPAWPGPPVPARPPPPAPVRASTPARPGSRPRRTWPRSCGSAVRGPSSPRAAGSAGASAGVRGGSASVSARPSPPRPRPRAASVLADGLRARLTRGFAFGLLRPRPRARRLRLTASASDCGLGGNLGRHLDGLGAHRLVGFAVILLGIAPPPPARRRPRRAPRTRPALLAPPTAALLLRCRPRPPAQRHCRRAVSASGLGRDLVVLLVGLVLDQILVLVDLVHQRRRRPTPPAAPRAPPGSRS